MGEEKQQTFEEVMEMQRIVAANRDGIIVRLLADKETAVADCEAKLEDIASRLKDMAA